MIDDSSGNPAGMAKFFHAFSYAGKPDTFFISELRELPIILSSTRRIVHSKSIAENTTAIEALSPSR